MDSNRWLDAYPQSILDRDSLQILSTLLIKGNMEEKELASWLGIPSPDLKQKLHRCYKGDLLLVQPGGRLALTDKAKFALSEFGFAGIAAEHILPSLSLSKQDQKFMVTFLEWKDKTDPASMGKTVDLLRTFSSSKSKFSRSDNLAFAIVLGLDPVASYLDSDQLFDRVLLLGPGSGKTSAMSRLHSRFDHARWVVKMSDDFIVSGQPASDKHRDEVYSLTAIRLMNLGEGNEPDPRLYYSCKANSKGPAEAWRRILKWNPSLKKRSLDAVRQALESEGAFQFHSLATPLRHSVAGAPSLDLVGEKIESLATLWESRRGSTSSKRMEEVAARLDDLLGMLERRGPPLSKTATKGHADKKTF